MMTISIGFAGVIMVSKSSVVRYADVDKQKLDGSTYTSNVLKVTLRSSRSIDPI